MNLSPQLVLNLSDPFLRSATGNSRLMRSSSQLVGPAIYRSHVDHPPKRCSGALNTPKLLELSGIGNPNIINRLGIPTIVDLPGVGENLQDHLMVNSDFVAKDGIYSFGKHGLSRRRSCSSDDLL
jgi:hypothetical protein